jgi:hypothetical protein
MVEPGLQKMADLGAFHSAAHGIEYLYPRLAARPEKAYPIGDVQLAGNRLCHNRKTVYPEESSTEKRTLEFLHDLIALLGWGKTRLGTIPGFKTNQLRRPWNGIEAIQIQRTRNRVNAKNVLFLLGAIARVHLEQAERDIKFCDRAQRSQSKLAKNSPRAARRKLRDRFVSTDVGSQTANRRHILYRK